MGSTPINHPVSFTGPWTSLSRWNSRKWHSDNDAPYRLITKYEAYRLLKQNHRLHKLPDISEETLNMFCMMHNSKLFSKSEFVLESTFPDRSVFHELYRAI